MIDCCPLILDPANVTNIRKSKRRRTSNKKAKALDSESDDAPLIAKQTQSGHKKLLKKPPKIKAADIGEPEDSDTPLEIKLARTKSTIEKRAEKVASSAQKENRAASKPQKKKVKDESDDDQPLVRKPQLKRPVDEASASAVKKKKQSGGVKAEGSEDKVPLSRKVQNKKKITAATDNANPARTGSKSETHQKDDTDQDREAQEEEEEEEYHWWEDPTKGDGTQKWTTLEHNGVVFPPPYEPLPQNIKMRYGGKPVTMALEAEEIAGFFGAMLNSTQNVENPTFQKNFFLDFQSKLKETGGAQDQHGKKIEIQEFSKCDFKPIFEYYDGLRAEKKALPSVEKKKLKADKDAAEAPYMYCIWDGRKQKVGNFRIEPPGLFRGRGEHPKTGKVKQRVEPEQITINIGKEAMVPAPPEGHRWKEIKHDKEGTWLAMWQENINGAYKYVMLAANSDVKGQSDYKKFEKARELKVGNHYIV